MEENDRYENLSAVIEDSRIKGTHLIFECDRIKGYRITQIDKNSRDIIKESKYFGMTLGEAIEQHGKSWINLEEIAKEKN